MKELKTVARAPAQLSFPVDAHAIIIFDGQCVFCSRWMQRIARRDRAGFFLFARRDSPAGKEALARAGVAEGEGTIAILTPDGRGLVRSEAVIYVGARLGFPYSLASAGRILPRSLRDGAYNLIARNRSKLAKGTCPVPSAEFASRVRETAL